MDYSKSGYPQQGKKAPRHNEHNPKPAPDEQARKVALLARMKAAAEASKAEAARIEAAKPESERGNLAKAGKARGRKG